MAVLADLRPEGFFTLPGNQAYGHARQAVLAGIPVPAFSSALAYFDGYRSANLPANLLQAQRDYFGAHTYERVDRPRGEIYHTEWTETSGKTVSGTYIA